MNDSSGASRAYTSYAWRKARVLVVVMKRAAVRRQNQVAVVADSTRSSDPISQSPPVALTSLGRSETGSATWLPHSVGADAPRKRLRSVLAQSHRLARNAARESQGSPQVLFLHALPAPSVRGRRAQRPIESDRRRKVRQKFPVVTDVLLTDFFELGRKLYEALNQTFLRLGHGMPRTAFCRSSRMLWSGQSVVVAEAGIAEDLLKAANGFLGLQDVGAPEYLLPGLQFVTRSLHRRTRADCGGVRRSLVEVVDDDLELRAGGGWGLQNPPCGNTAPQKVAAE